MKNRQKNTRGARLTRREFLRVGAVGALVTSSLPLWGCGDGGEKARPEIRGRFFNAHQYATMEAATGRLIPTDEDPGAVEARVVDYIDGLLSAFVDYDAGKGPAPRIFAGGPFSGRVGGENLLDCRPCHDGFPAREGHEGQNDFQRFLPLSRIREIAWRMRIEGSQGIPEREFNGPVTGWQEVYTEGIALLDRTSQKLFGRDFVTLSPEEQDEVLKAMERADGEAKEFVTLLYRHTVEGMYAAPEYGGNRDTVGWRYIQFEGDRQPVGFSRFNVDTGEYEEFPATPVSAPDPVKE